MTSILLSEAQSRLGRALLDLFTARGEAVAVAGRTAATDGKAVLVVTDLASALMAGGARAAAPGAETALGAERLAQIEALVEAAAARVVLVSGPVRPSGTTPPNGAERDAQRIEATIARKAASRAVILRASDVMDPADAVLRAAVRGIVEGAATTAWPASDTVQVIALADLAAATAAAAQARGIKGKWFDIVHPEAVSRVAVQAEVQRLARLLVDPDAPPGQSRPVYPPVIPRRDGVPGAEALHVRPQASVFVILAQTIQSMIAESVRQGTIPPVVPPLPAVHRALETGALPLAGRCAVITGATGQIGMATARMLVRLGADVIGIARRTKAGETMEQAFADEHAFLTRQRNRLDAERAHKEAGQPAPGKVGRFRFISADLADQSALTALATRLTNEFRKIDILIHLAGSVSKERRETVQGVEAVLALHQLAPVALTRRLAGPLRHGDGAWVINPVSFRQSFFPFDLGDLQSSVSYTPGEVLARVHSGLVALTGALAEGMTGTGVNIAAVALRPVRTPFPLPLEAPLDGGAAAQKATKTRNEQRLLQMDTPAQAASRLIEVLLARDFAQAHGCLIVDGAIAGSILTADQDRERIAALWAAGAKLAGLPA